MGGFALLQGVAPPALVNPIDMQAKVASLGDLLQQRQLRAAQMQEYQAQADQRNRDLAEQNQLGQIIKNNSQDIGNGNFDSILKSGLSTANTAPVIDKLQQMRTAIANGNKVDNENYTTHLGWLKDSLMGLPKDNPAAAAQGYSAAKQRMQSAEPKIAAQMPDLNPADPDFYTKLNGVGTLTGVSHAMLVSQAALDKETAATNASKAEADLNAAKIPGARATAQMEQQKADLMKQAISDYQNNPDGSVHPIDVALPPTLDKTANASFKADFKTAMMYGGPEAAAKVVSAAAAHAAELSPEKRAADVKEATDKERAASSIILNREVALQNILNKQQGPELAGVALKDQPLVKAKYEKNLTDFNNSLADANRLHTLIQSAQSGNKSAPAVIPLAELRGFVNRVNSTELRSVGGAGDLLDKVQGWLQGKTEGQPIPPDILQATDQLTALQAKNAQSKHNAQTTIDNKVYHANYKPATPQELGYGAISSNGGGSTGAPPVPTKFQMSDVGKTYYSPTQGKNIKVTAVDPVNNRFKWQPAQ